MARLSKFQKSQNAHAYFRDKYIQMGDEVSLRKAAYHSIVRGRQARYGVILTKTQREFIFKQCR